MSDALIQLQEDLDHNTVFFVGDGYEDLIRSLDSKNFFHSTTTSLLWKREKLSLGVLRLDSSVLFYSGTENGGFVIEESYSVKGGPPKQQKVGEWNKDSGLDIPIRNVWDRRTGRCS